MTKMANNYITLPRTGSRRSKNRWAYIGAVASICGLLGVYGASKANAYDNIDCEAIEQMVVNSFATDQNAAAVITSSAATKKRIEEMQELQKEVRSIINTYTNVYNVFCKYSNSTKWR